MLFDRILGVLGIALRWATKLLFPPDREVASDEGSGSHSDLRPGPTARSNPSARTNFRATDKGSSPASKPRHIDDLEPNSVSECYEILGVHSDRPSVTDVKSAYRRLIREYHPDKVESSDEDTKKDAHDKSRKINGAYELLKRNGLLKNEPQVGSSQA